MIEQIERKKSFHLASYLTCLLAVGLFVPFLLPSAETVTSLEDFIFGDNSDTLVSPPLLSVLFFSLLSFLFLCFRVRLRLCKSNKPFASLLFGGFKCFSEAFRSMCVGSLSVLLFGWLNGLNESEDFVRLSGRILFTDATFAPFLAMTHGMAL